MCRNQERLHKEIDIIQSCITRMANNSFLIKGWFISTILAFIGFGYEKFNNFILIIILIIITLFSWISDAYFLQLERLYRNKYNWVIMNRLNNNFKKSYNLNPNQKKLKLKNKYFSSFFSKTLIFLYCIPLIILIFILIFTFSHNIFFNIIKINSNTFLITI